MAQLFVTPKVWLLGFGLLLPEPVASPALRPRNPIKQIARASGILGTKEEDKSGPCGGAVALASPSLTPSALCTRFLQAQGVWGEGGRKDWNVGYRYSELFSKSICIGRVERGWTPMRHGPLPPPATSHSGSPKGEKKLGRRDLK